MKVNLNNPQFTHQPSFFRYDIYTEEGSTKYVEIKIKGAYENNLKQID